jgi:hypothetical protein
MPVVMAESVGVDAPDEATRTACPPRPINDRRSARSRIVSPNRDQQVRDQENQRSLEAIVAGLVRGGLLPGTWNSNNDDTVMGPVMMERRSPRWWWRGRSRWCPHRPSRAWSERRRQDARTVVAAFTDATWMDEPDALPTPARRATASTLTPAHPARRTPSIRGTDGGDVAVPVPVLPRHRTWSGRTTRTVRYEVERPASRASGERVQGSAAVAGLHRPAPRLLVAPTQLGQPAVRDRTSATRPTRHRCRHRRVH